MRFEKKTQVGIGTRLTRTRAVRTPRTRVRARPHLPQTYYILINPV